LTVDLNYVLIIIFYSRNAPAPAIKNYRQTLQVLIIIKLFFTSSLVARIIG